jgi:hypothetical protein
MQVGSLACVAALLQELISTVNEASDNARADARATRQSIMRAPMKSSESISSTGVSKSKNSFSVNSASMG